MSINPYKAPEESIIEDELNDFEEMRHEYLKHERRVRSLAPFFYALTAAICILGALSLFNPVTPLLGLIIIALSYIPLWTAQKIKTLESNARIPLILLAIACLPLFPVGTIISGILIFLIFSPSGIMLFSDEYIEAIKETPHIECKVSIASTIIAWSILGLFLLSFTFVYFLAQHN